MRLYAYGHGLIRYAYVLYYTRRLARALELAEQVFVMIIKSSFLYERFEPNCGKHRSLGVTDPPPKCMFTFTLS